MAEQIRYNQLYDALSPVDQQSYAGYKIARNLVPSERETQDEAFPDYKEILDAEAAANKTKPNMWNPMNWIFSPAESAMATPEERAAIERSSADIERRTGTDNPLPVGRDQGLLRYRDPQQYYMENRPDDYDYWREGPIGETGRRPDKGGVIEYQEPYPHIESYVGRKSQADLERYPFLKEEREYNPILQRALISQNRKNLYGDDGIAAIDIQETMGPEKTITAEGWRLPDTDFGPVRRTASQAGPNKFDRFLQRFGAPAMTQVTAADKLANKQFMGQQRIGRDPQTGRMIGGDFAGKNAPGTSAWGSANFGEMATKWDEDYGDVEYSLGAMGDMKRKKQARMKQLAAQHAQKVAADRQERIRNQRAQASAANQMTQRDPTGGGASGRHMGNISQAQASQVAEANAAAGMGGWGLAHGGRVGYNTGGRVGILSAF